MRRGACYATVLIDLIDNVVRPPVARHKTLHSYTVWAYQHAALTELSTQLMIVDGSSELDVA